MRLLHKMFLPALLVFIAYGIYAWTDVSWGRRAAEKTLNEFKNYHHLSFQYEEPPFNCMIVGSTRFERDPVCERKAAAWIEEAKSQALVLEAQYAKEVPFDTRLKAYKKGTEPFIYCGVDSAQPKCVLKKQ